MTREIRIALAADPDRVAMTIAGGDNQSPAWIDNRRLSFGSNRDGLQKIHVSGVCALEVECAGKGLQDDAERVRIPDIRPEPD